MQIVVCIYIHKTRTNAQLEILCEVFWVICTVGFDGVFSILNVSSVGKRKEDLLINALVDRVTNDGIEEVILATSATVEGQTTAYYIQNSLKNSKVKITKLAQGLPVGGEIENLDDGTLYSAFKNRSKLSSN